MKFSAVTLLLFSISFIEAASTKTITGSVDASIEFLTKLRNDINKLKPSFPDIHYYVVTNLSIREESIKKLADLIENCSALIEQLTSTNTPGHVTHLKYSKLVANLTCAKDGCNFTLKVMESLGGKSYPSSRELLWHMNEGRKQCSKNLDLAKWKCKDLIKTLNKMRKE